MLRELTPQDYQQFFDLNSDPEVIKYTGDKAFGTLNAARKFLEQYDAYSKYGMGRWAVILKSSNEFTGWCGLKFMEELNAVDLGYRFFRKFWNQGIATESAKACVEYGFNHYGLKRIIGRAMKENIASVKVLEKCGMHFVKEIQFDEHPGLLYEIENPAWEEKDYIPIDCNFYDELEALATLKKQSVIIYKNEIGVVVTKDAILKTFFTQDKTEYAELNDGTVFRLDNLVSLNGKKLPSSC